MTVGFTLVMGTFLSSYSPNFVVFTFLYMILFAFGNGMLYMLPIFIIARYFPQNKGKVTGVILGAYGLGALISGYIVMFLTNPDNRVPVLSPDGGNYFNSDVADNVPFTLRMLAAYYFFLLAIATIFL